MSAPVISAIGHRKRRPRLTAPKGASAYRQLWRVVDGAVADALACHPDYLTPKGQSSHTARRSIVKRVVGAVLGYAEQMSFAGQPAEARSGYSPAGDRGAGAVTSGFARSAQSEFLTALTGEKGGSPGEEVRP